MEKAHNKGITFAAWFWPSDPDYYYDLFELGIDVIITDYPVKVAKQLNEYYSMYSYIDKDIVAIKLLFSPFGDSGICQIGGKLIFYFEWRFDLYDEYGRKYIISDNYEYAKLTEKQIKKLDFSQIEIYIGVNKINKNDFLCKDLYDIKYYTIYRVMAAHWYFIYNGKSQDSYFVKFKLFDENYISFVTYDNKYLINKGSYGKSDYINFYSSSTSDEICNNMVDPFEDNISCIDKIINCKYCKNENICLKCNEGFFVFDGNCESTSNLENNLKYYTPDNGINYYKCSSKIDYCEECSYNDYILNKIHCSKCPNGLILNEKYECEEEKFYEPIILTTKYDKKVKFGDKITFEIKKIHQNNFKLYNNEIIL